MLVNNRRQNYPPLDGLCIITTMIVNIMMIGEGYGRIAVIAPAALLPKRR